MIDSITESAGGPPDLRRARRRKQPSSDATRVDRLPPHSPEAEQSVLGCILLSPNDCMGERIARLKGGSVVFYDRRNQALFDLMAEMFEKRVVANMVTLNDWLKQAKRNQQFGG